ncbi:MAG: hypothetical protein EZS28_017224 [Streblomastix strix]|uniref:Uncharacterized protein n=1 Tax=Streblomastix strix TaxID=222440 RepID=A0A5J4VXX8_9EUKA|nr:MAG: hypothetical protein EZS28_017224 [Streblomastix strix]
MAALCAAPEYIEEVNRYFADRTENVLRSFDFIRKKIDEYAKALMQPQDKLDAIFASISDYKGSEVEDLRVLLERFIAGQTIANGHHQKVIQQLLNIQRPLSNYPIICKNVKSALEMRVAAIETYKDKKAKFDIEQAKGVQNDKFNKALQQQQQAANQLRQTTLNAQERITDFEINRVSDIKRIIQEICLEQMNYHCRGIEQMSDIISMAEKIIPEKLIEKQKKIIDGLVVLKQDGQISAGTLDQRNAPSPIGQPPK